MSEPKRMLSGDKLNLERLQFLLVDDNAQALDIMGQVVSGFGVRNMIKCASAAEAREAVGRSVIDFILTDAQMPGENGYDFVRWVRTEAHEPNRFAPIIIITGHTPQSQVLLARDCGAHFVVTKPLTPRVILERIFWVARDERKFIETDTYCGPDRRVKRLGPPPGTDGRRKDDLQGAVGAASEPNMSQDDIDALMTPAKVSI